MPKAHRLMYSLIYPAVLGTVLINVFIPISNFISGQLIYGTKFTFIKLFLTVGIVFHFAVDYLFAEEAQENGWKGFFIDTLILMGLWIAASSIQMNQKEVPNFAWLSGALAFVYAVFIFYVCKFCKHYQSWERVAIVESLGFLWFRTRSSSPVSLPDRNTKTKIIREKYNENLCAIFCYSFNVTTHCQCHSRWRPWDERRRIGGRY